MSNYAVIENGLVVNTIVWDGTPFTPGVDPTYDADGNQLTDGTLATGWAPPDGQTAMLIPDDQPVSIGWSFDGTNFSQPPLEEPTAAQVLASNSAMRDSLFANASVAIAPLQMAVSLGEATDEETASAKAWVAYSRAVKAVDVTQPSPVWPTAPSA